MNHALFVRGFECRRDLHAHRRHFFFRQWAIFQAVGKRGSSDVFHHHEIDVVLNIEIVHGGDVGMIQLGEGQRLGAKSLARGITGQLARGQHL